MVYAEQRFFLLRKEIDSDDKSLVYVGEPIWSITTFISVEFLIDFPKELTLYTSSEFCSQ